jgi:hypothetical protein
MNLLGSGSLGMRIGLLAGGAVVLMIVAAIVISALTPKGDTAGLTSIAQRQQEMVRVTTAALQQSQVDSQDAKNFVTNVELCAASDQQQLLAFMGTHGTKLSSKTLALDQSTATDTQLANAATANNFDSAITANLVQQLQAYESLLSTTYHQTSNTQTHTLLQSSYNNASLLIKQAKALQQELGG